MFQSWNSNFRNKLMEITLWQNIIFWTVLSHLKFIIYMNFFYIIILIALIILFLWFNNYATNSLDPMHWDFIGYPFTLIVNIISFEFLFSLLCLISFCFNIHIRFLQSVLWWLRKMRIIIFTIIIISFTFLL